VKLSDTTLSIRFVISVIWNDGMYRVLKYSVTMLEVLIYYYSFILETGLAPGSKSEESKCPLILDFKNISVISIENLTLRHEFSGVKKGTFVKSNSQNAVSRVK